ncbi:MAG: GntR family transcriptional regulator [Thermodesulfovibrionales bacterium]|nr:GntR family transcriptional regulator [Thermodesulfovibrionales bacterium]
MIKQERSVNRDKPQKLYIQLLDIIRERIEAGEWPVGSQIPIEEELCRVYGVSKATVRFAVLELVRKGYLKRQQGKGTFVCKRVIPEGLTMSSSFKELMLEHGIAYTTILLAQTVLMPIDDLDVKLEIPENTHVIYIKRLRSVEGEPAVIQESFIPHHICPSLLKEDVVENSLFELFENKYDITITGVRDFIEVAYSSAGESKLLGLPKDSPVLLLEQHFYSGESQIMYMRSVKRPERFRLSIDFKKKE